MVILKRELQVITASTSLDKLITWMKKMCIDLFLSEGEVQSLLFLMMPMVRCLTIGRRPQAKHIAVTEATQAGRMVLNLIMTRMAMGLLMLLVMGELLVGHQSTQAEGMKL